MYHATQQCWFMMFVWNTNACNRFEAGGLIHVSQIRVVMKVKRFLSEGPLLALCHEAKGGGRCSADLLIAKISCFGLFLPPCLFITQNVLCSQLEICSWWMNFIIDRFYHREKEGLEVALWIPFPLRKITCRGQKVACSESRREWHLSEDTSWVSIKVPLRSHSLAYFFRPRGNFRGRWKVYH